MASILKYRVFISHGSADIYIAKTIRQQLEAKSIDTFLDDADIIIGSNFRQSILGKIRDCDELVVLLTPTSIQRAWVFAEVGIATDHDRPVVGIQYGVNMHELHDRGVISLIGDTRIVDLNDIDRYIAAVVERAGGSARD
jgi:hypothetical protein